MLKEGLKAKGKEPRGYKDRRPVEIDQKGHWFSRSFSYPN